MTGPLTPEEVIPGERLINCVHWLNLAIETMLLYVDNNFGSKEVASATG